ncbi:hypothetical protein MMC34_001616 [Xylographa carneopallida]|nr:hypothetical protein [Xylographa carneopallida]
MAPISLPTLSTSTRHWRRAFLTSLSPLSTRSLPQLSESTTLQPLVRTLSSLARRQQGVFPIPASYAGLNAGPDAGTVVGITLGSVAGFLLILWLIYTCFNMGNGMGNGAIVAEEVVSRRSLSPPRPRRSRPSRTRSPSRSEMSEVISPPRRERRETVIIEETRRPAEREDDIVEVIEEHSPPPRRVRSQRVSGYRTVEPDAFGGGDMPLRKVRR